MGSAIAYKLNAAFVPLRKPDKLPYKTFSAAYDLEYGSTEMHIHRCPGWFQNVIIIDDLWRQEEQHYCGKTYRKSIRKIFSEQVFLLTFLPRR